MNCEQDRFLGEGSSLSFRKRSDCPKELSTTPTGSCSAAFLPGSKPPAFAFSSASLLHKFLSPLPLSMHCESGKSEHQVLGDRAETVFIQNKKTCRCWRVTAKFTLNLTNSNFVFNCKILVTPPSLKGACQQFMDVMQ